MKRILITGVNSYVGKSFAEYVAANAPSIQTESISLRDVNPGEIDWSRYDAVFHVAGKAHADTSGASDAMREEYYRVNRDLTEAVARAAAEGGVRQFIHMSSVIIYGDSAPIGSDFRITEDTPIAPAGFYGDSKKQAEERLAAVALDYPDMKIAILRCPMIYGPESKGNYRFLQKIAAVAPVFPIEKNRRSMLRIDRLCAFVCRLVKEERGGVFFPQDPGYGNTSMIVEELGSLGGNRIIMTQAFHPMLKVLSQSDGKLGKLTNKAFGSMTIDKSLPGIRYKKKKVPLPSAAVVTVVYNAGDVIERTLDSVLNQTVMPAEYILIDGASTDNTLEIIESYRIYFEIKGVKYRVISEPDSGIYNAMNKGVRMATADIVGILGAGDCYEPDMIKLTQRRFAQKNADVTFANINIVRADGSVITKPARRRYFQTSRDWNHPTMFVKTAVAKKYPYLEKGIHDDYGFYLLLVKKGYRIATINRTLASFYLGGASNARSLTAAVSRIRDRYRYCYRVNGYSRLYLIECIAIEAAKYLLG